MPARHPEPDAHHVLLVDSDEHSRLIYSAILRHRGYVVSAAADCETALGEATNVHLRVLLLDPHDCEEGALGLLRHAVASRGIPTLALTSRVTEPELTDLCAQGFDAVLMKPIGPTDVAEAVGAALGRLRATGAALGDR